MPEYDIAKKTSLVSAADQEQYLVKSRLELVRVLSELTKRPDIITAYFDSGQQYILTAVLGVIEERNLIVLDYGPDEMLNQRALEFGQLVCVTKHDRIDTRFTVTNLQRAKYQDRQVLAAPLPETVYRLQRREYFRVHTPVANPLKCKVPVKGGSPLVLDVVDISVGGLGLVDYSLELEMEAHEVIKGCTIDLPHFGELRVDLQIRNFSLQPYNNEGQIRRIGCAFFELPTKKHTKIQRYINKLQIDQKALSKRP